MDITLSLQLRPLQGTVRVPGDKSISHRAVLFASIAEGASHLSGVLDSADVRASISCMQELGAKVDLEKQPDGSLAGCVKGWHTLQHNDQVVTLYCGNSGTTARLLMGILAGAGRESVLTGDDSLSARPMRRVSEPLLALGCNIELTGGRGTLPAHIHASDHLAGATVELSVASAQVKSAVLLAGTFAPGLTTVREPAQSRNHTELLLPAFGVAVSRHALTTRLKGPAMLRAADIVVPGDPSSAAFFAVAAAMIPQSKVKITNVLLNPTRTGFIEVMKRMGARIDIDNVCSVGAEQVGDVTVFGTDTLFGCDISSDEIPSLVDEIPILAVFATKARGKTRFSGVGELRVKESDRLAAIIEGIRHMGGYAEEDGDDLVVEGVPLRGGVRCEAHADHRMAMTWVVAGLSAELPTTVGGIESIDVSFPDFLVELGSIQTV